MAVEVDGRGPRVYMFYVSPVELFNVASASGQAKVFAVRDMTCARVVSGGVSVPRERWPSHSTDVEVNSVT